MIGFLIRLAVSALGLWLASELVAGISHRGAGDLVLAALLLGIVNALLRPILIFVTFPLTVVTFGLFLFVVNAMMLGLVGAILPGFTVNGFWAAVLGSIVVSLVSWLASGLTEKRGPPEGPPSRV